MDKLKRQWRFMLDHVVIGAAVVALAIAAQYGGLVTWSSWDEFWAVAISVIGTHRETVNDWGQHLRPGNYWKRFRYGINPANIDLQELVDDWPQVAGWWIGAFLTLWILGQ